MSETNGTSARLSLPPIKIAKPRAKRVPAAKSSKPRSKRRTRYSAPQRLSLLIGSIASFVLLLSVWHCTEAISALTGSPVVLALLLAVGIDAGMVASELASIASESHAKRWADAYIVLSVLLSSGLNAYASGSHATDSVALAWLVGGLIPLLVFVLAKIAGHLWSE